MAPMIHIVGARWMSGWLHVSAALPPGKLHRYLLNRRLDGPQTRHFGEENKIPVAHTAIGTPDRPARRLVHIPSMLVRLL